MMKNGAVKLPCLSSASAPITAITTTHTNKANCHRWCDFQTQPHCWREQVGALCSTASISEASVRRELCGRSLSWATRHVLLANHLCFELLSVILSVICVHTHTQTSQQVCDWGGQQSCWLVFPFSSQIELFRQPVCESIVCVCFCAFGDPGTHRVHVLVTLQCSWVIKSCWIGLSGRLTQPAVTHQSSPRVSDLTHSDWRNRGPSVEPHCRPHRKLSTPSCVLSQGFGHIPWTFIYGTWKSSCWFSVSVQDLMLAVWLCCCDISW